MRPNFILEFDLFQPLPRRVVLVLRRFAGQWECPLPHAVGELGNVGRHAGEGHRVALDARGQVAPKALERVRDRVRRAGAQRFADILDGGAALVL